MRITDIESIILRLPIVRLIGDGCQTVLVVLVHTDEGLTGIGECHTNPFVAKTIIESPHCSVLARGLRELLLGEDPRDVNRLYELMCHHTATYGRRGIVMHAISGIEIALWDILGKAVGQPVSRLLGGRTRSALRAYASDLAPASDAEAVAQAEKHAADGYKAVKLGWGRLGADAGGDAAMVGAIRKAVGDDIDLMLDIGVPMPIDTATRLAHELAEHRVYFLEEPLSPDDLSGYARLTAISPTPIATGEKETTLWPYINLIDHGGLRIVQPDVARVGGISEGRRIATFAAARGAQVIPHCWSTDILVAATLHCMATVDNCPFIEINATDNPLRTSLLCDPIRQHNGMVAVPDGPGLGIELDREMVARYRV